MNDFLGHTLFVIGNTPVTLGSIAVLVGILVGSYTVSRIIQRILRSWIISKSNIAHGAAANTLRLLHY